MTAERSEFANSGNTGNISIAIDGPAGAAHRSVSSRSGTRIWGRMLSPSGGYLPTGCLRTSSALALTRAMSSSGVPLVRMSWNWVR